MDIWHCMCYHHHSTKMCTIKYHKYTEVKSSVAGDHFIVITFNLIFGFPEVFCYSESDALIAVPVVYKCAILWCLCFLHLLFCCGACLRQFVHLCLCIQICFCCLSVCVCVHMCMSWDGWPGVYCLQCVSSALRATGNPLLPYAFMYA